MSTFYCLCLMKNLFWQAFILLVDQLDHFKRFFFVVVVVLNFIKWDLE